MPRTPDEILVRIGQANDFFGTEKSDLISYLPFEQAKHFLEDDATEEKWDEAREKGDPLDLIRAYLPFAWDKANNARGLSAARSMYHFTGWLWLAGIDENLKLTDYELYGKPQLVMISEALGFDWRAEDDGIWANSEVYSIEEGIGTERRDALIAEWVQKGAELKEKLERK